MSVIVLVRTRNESKRIASFCNAYKDATRILVADGGSQDQTKAIAASFPNVEIRDFTERTELENGQWRNNDARHVNFLIDWAKEYETDFLILDDADIRPTKALKENYQNILEDTTADFVHVVRFYFWGKDKYFPLMSSPGGELEPSLWAWRGNLDFRMIDVPPAYEFSLNGQKVNSLRTEQSNLDLYPPLALLHYSWDEERIKQKIKAYKKSGFIPGYDDPRKFAGQMLPKTDWMIE